jgi:hypothetical protein
MSCSRAMELGTITSVNVRRALACASGSQAHIRLSTAKQPVCCPSGSNDRLNGFEVQLC